MFELKFTKILEVRCLLYILFALILTFLNRFDIHFKHQKIFLFFRRSIDQQLYINLLLVFNVFGN